MSESTTPDITKLVADIVSAYVSKNAVQAEDLPSLVRTVHAALEKAAQGQPEEPKLR